MSTSLAAFRTGLHEEHLEEVSFLYAQLRFQRQSGQPWRQALKFEHRLELHLDALVVGGEFALGVCRRRVDEGDPGELHGAASLYCRLAQPALMASLLKRLDPDDDEQAAAVASALQQELPPAWSGFIEQALGRGDDRLVRILSAACAYRRIDCGAALLAALRRSETPSVELVGALGRLRTREAEPDLKSLVAKAAPPVQSASLLALLMLGEHATLRAHYLAAQQHEWPRIALGLAGDPGAAHALMQAPASGQAAASSLLALGLLGLPTTLRHLYECLAFPALAESAAQALNWITGADLYQDVHVPDPVDESELFPKELKAWRAYKEAPRAADGLPFGAVQRKLSIAPADWKSWFSDNLRRFDPQLRYRRGVPCSPAQLVSDIAAPHTDGVLRRYSALELAIRYGYPGAFEVDMPVIVQVHAIRAMHQWLASAGQAFSPGSWYFNGQPLQVSA